MAGQISTSTLAELRRAIRVKERKLSELDLMLVDYHAERSLLIRELRRLLAQLRDAEEESPSVPKED